MKQTIILIFISLLSIFQLEAQNASTDNVLGMNHFIDSEVLEDKRQVQIHLPSGYDTDADKKYPVLYVLDGQQFFSYAVSLSIGFNQHKIAPEFIIVGINNNYPQRYTLLNGGKEKFIEFIKKDLRPFIDNTYRTKDENLLFGWEYAGSLVFNTMISEPALFDAYFIASPFPIVQPKVDVLGSMEELNKSFYYYDSPDENMVNQGINRLNTLFNKKNIKGLDWSYSHLEDEKHFFTGYPALNHSLQKYFGYYPELFVENLKKFLDKGGIEYAHAYTKERARKYGFSTELSLRSKFSMVQSAFDAKDFPQLELFIETLCSEKFFVDLIKNDKDWEVTSIAYYYRVYEEFEKAIAIYKLYLEKHPKSAAIMNRIGSSYKALGNEKEAEKYLKKAGKISKSKS